MKAEPAYRRHVIKDATMKLRVFLSHTPEMFEGH
jgi:hypothetical protein